MKTSRRGAAEVLVLYLVGGLLLTQAVPNWRVTRLFAKKADTKAVAAAIAEKEKAEAELAAIKADVEKSRKEAEERKDEQVRSAQEYVAATVESLSRVPDEHVTKEVAASRLLASRADIALAMAIGSLPRERQAEMVRLVDGLLSQHQAEIAAAMRKIEERDNALLVIQGEKESALRRLTEAEAKAAVEAAKVVTLNEKVVEKTNEVLTWVEKKNESEREAGSLKSLLESIVIWGVAIWAFAHFLLPSLAAEFPSIKPLQWTYRTLASLTSAHQIKTDPL